jgi:hypothetical protein
MTDDIRHERIQDPRTVEAEAPTDCGHCERTSGHRQNHVVDRVRRTNSGISDVFDPVMMRITR